MGRPNIAVRLAGLRPCGCTGTRLCPEHWRALTAEQRREWRRTHQHRVGAAP